MGLTRLAVSIVGLLSAIPLLLGSTGGSAAQESVADFYRGRTITCYIGYASGGGYDVYARVISRFMQMLVSFLALPSYLKINNKE